MELKIQEMQMLEIPEYCGEACKIYFAKHRVCFSLHPEPCILLLTKGKLGVVVKLLLIHSAFWTGLKLWRPWGNF